MRTVVVLDTETTGFLPYDRIVSLAAVRSVEASPNYELLYRCFDPRKDSHPGAFAVHGWDDWTTRFQDLFADQAAELHDWLSSADMIVAHNADFDLRYVNREFRKCGLPPLSAQSFCTMDAAGSRWSGSATLDASIARCGLSRRGARHDALEDAFLTWNLFRHLHGMSLVAPPSEWPQPSNYRTPPPRPAGELPRRERKVPGARSPRWSAAQRKQLFDTARAPAIIMLYLAASDGSIEASEQQLVAGLVAQTAERIGLPPSPNDLADVVRALLDIRATGNLLTRAIGAVVDEPDTRRELPRLIAAMATSSGALTTAKSAALATLSDAIRKRMARSD